MSQHNHTHFKQNFPKRPQITDVESIWILGYFFNYGCNSSHNVEYYIYLGNPEGVEFRYKSFNISNDETWILKYLIWYKCFCSEHFSVQEVEFLTCPVFRTS